MSAIPEGATHFVRAQCCSHSSIWEGPLHFYSKGSVDTQGREAQRLADIDASLHRTQFHHGQDRVDLGTHSGEIGLYISADSIVGRE